MGSTTAVKARFAKRTKRIRTTVGLSRRSLSFRNVQRVWEVRTVPKTTDCFSEKRYSRKWSEVGHFDVGLINVDSSQ